MCHDDGRPLRFSGLQAQPVTVLFGAPARPVQIFFVFFEKDFL
jgi:hypothetical protein